MRGVKIGNYEESENLCPDDLSLSTSSLVVNTSTDDCSLKCGSFDQIGILSNARDNARYSVSFLSDMSLFACLRESSNSPFGTELIFPFIISQSAFNSLYDSPDKSFILDLCFSNSSNKYSGEYNSAESEKMISLVIPFPISPVNNTVASITNFNPIYFSSGYNSLYFLCNDALTSSANLFASSSVNLDLEIISLAAENSISLTKDFIDFDNTNSNLSLNSSGTSTLIFISAMNGDDCLEYINFSGEDEGIEKEENFFQENGTDGKSGKEQIK